MRVREMIKLGCVIKFLEWKEMFGNLWYGYVLFFFFRLKGSYVVCYR